MTDESWLRDSGIACSYDGEAIEYLDGVIVTFIVKPGLYNGALVFYDIMTEEQNDYLYEPAFFHSKNWDEIEEKFLPYAEEVEAIDIDKAIAICRFCKSGILEGETTCVATFGEVLRSQRNPDLKTYGNHFENMDHKPYIICISCIRVLNEEVHEIWPDGVCHNDECQTGTVVRCWRDGCGGNCEQAE